MSTTRDIEKIVRKLRRGVGTSVSKRAMRILGQQMIKLIVARSRRGLSVERTGAAERRFKPLSGQYVRFRSENRFKLDRTTSPAKSNITFTGQMLRSMTVKSNSDRFVRIGPNRRVRRGGITNERLAQIVSRQRPFNNLSKKEISKLLDFVDKNLQSILDKSGL